MTVRAGFGNDGLLPCQEYEPEYLCWYERDFMADRVVVRMTPLQRLMYRALLQATPYCSTRPYLPDDEDELMNLSDAPDIETWRENSAPILKKFVRTEFDGVGYWAHKRILADYRHMLESDSKRRLEWDAKQGKRSESARKASTKRWEKERAQPSDSDANGCESHSTMRHDASNETETEPQTEKKSEKEKQHQATETEINIDSVSGSVDTKAGIKSNSVVTPRSVSVSGSVSGEMRIEVECLVELWLSTRKENERTAADNASQPIIQLIQSGVTTAEIKQVLLWLPKSNYWGKPGKGDLKGTSGFRSAYKGIRNSYENYRESILASKQKKSKSSSEPTCIDGDEEYP